MVVVVYLGQIGSYERDLNFCVGKLDSVLLEILVNINSVAYYVIGY